MKKFIAFITIFAMLILPAFALPETLIPVGHTAGIKVLADGVIVSGVTQIATSSGPRFPAKEAGVLQGDTIKLINNKKINSNEDLGEQINKLQNTPIVLVIDRNGKQITTTITPVLDIKDGKYKIGIWVRDSLAGIGTITYIDPENSTYGALGHSISESDDTIFPLRNGELIGSSVSSVKKGEVGNPGELQGKFYVDNEIGTIVSNKESGIYGTIDKSYYNKMTAYPTAKLSEVLEGKATILANVSGDEIKSYEVEIVKIDDTEGECKNFLIKVTDPGLIKITGGIVQGMSGSPIIQNGKFVGGVTHVLVNNPTEGYGISIERMYQD